MNQWDQRSLVSKHTFVRTSEKAARQSFYDPDLKKALKSVEKSSPDYLPIYHNDTKNKYVSYEKQILANQTNFARTVKNNQLELTWNAKKAGTVQLPVIVYQNTKIVEKNREVTPSALSNIGVPTVKQKSGKNTVRVHYDPPNYIAAVFVLCTLTWLATFLWCLYHFFTKLG